MTALPSFGAYITIPDGQTASGSPIGIEPLYTTDLGAAGRQYRLLGKQSDGFNGTSLAAKWTKTDVGGDTTPAPTVSGGTLSLIGSGTDISGSSDQFTYLSQGAISGDFTLDVRVNSVQNTNTLAKAGLMVRETLNANSRHASILITPSSGVSFRWRTSTGGTTSTSTSSTSITAPRWLRLKRAGNSFTAFYSSDGRTWTQQGSARTVIMGSSVYIGLAVTSRNASLNCTSVFDNVHFMPAGQSGMVASWTNTSAASPASVTITTWKDGDYALSVRDTGTSVGPETNVFTWQSCADGTPSTITIGNGQTVKGSSVSLRNLFTYTGNPGNFTYQINGSGATNPWNSLAYGTGAPQAVTLTVTGIDPDCGGSTVTASNTITVDNTCTDGTPSALTVRTGQTTGGEQVDLTALYTKSGNVSGLTYHVEGVQVFTPWNSTAFGTDTPETVTFEVRGTDPDCGGSVILASNTLTVDNTCVRTPPTITLDQDVKYVGEGRALQFTATIHNQDSPNCSASTFNMAIAGETNGTDFVASSLSGGSNLLIPGGGSASALVTVRAKSTATEWNQNLTTLRVTSSQGEHGTVDKVVRTVVFLVSPITHNSITTGSGKWGGKWGTSETGSKYGNFTCLTCHEKGTGNIKWMQPSIATTDGTNWGNSGASNLPIVFQDGRSGDWWGNDDPNNDLSGRTSSNRACEICHSVTAYHRYNTNVDPDGGGPLTAQTEKRHFNGRRCIDCHHHSAGFTAGCDYCHGNPPLSAAPGSNGLAFVPETSGSNTMGTHFKHVKVLGYSCTYCHNTYRAPNTMPNTGPNGKANIDISFNVFNDRGVSGAALTAGSYSGQDGVSYNGSVVPPGNGTLSCTNLYCHGETIGGTDPTWNGNITCNACHGTSAFTPPPGRSHQTHVEKLGIGCSDCHGSTPVPGAQGHVNARVKWDVSNIARHKNAGPAVTYRGSVSGETGGPAPSATFGTCTNVACHYGRTTPPWNNSGNAATCTTCHNDGSDSALLTDSAPNTGAHADHMDPGKLMVSNWVNKCESCHGSGANDGKHPGHVNLSVEFADGFTYTAGTPGSCTNFCHGPQPLNIWSSTATLACHACHQAPYLGPTVVNPAGEGTEFAAGYGSHLKASKAETLSGSTDWDAQCRKCHPYHSGGVTVPLPPTSWDNPGTAAVETDNMRVKLGIDFPITGGIHLGGTATSGSTEADICWNCHGTDDTINEWGYNADVNDVGGTYPSTIIADINGQSIGSHNYGWVYTDSAWTTLAKGWVDASGKGMYRKDGYQHSSGNSYALSRRISSVHSADFTLGSNPGSSVANNIDASGNVKRDATQILETPGQIRCTYCHDVHDMNRALTDVANQTRETATGRPFLRGSWMGNPYGPDMPPIAGYSYPTTGGYHGRGQRFAQGTSSTKVFSVGVPRLLADPTLQAKGGYFIDQNGNWPTSGLTLDQTAGICVLCHGTDVDNMDYYTGSTMWRTGMVNGHSNAALGGTGVHKRNIFDGNRTSTAFRMAAQDMVNVNQSGDANGAKSSAPWRTRLNKAADGSAANSPPRNTGFYGGTVGSTTKGGQYGAWYNGTTTATTTAAIGTDGTTTKAHNFTCSKCHSPHATGLPALVLTNCLDFTVGKWTATADNSVVVGPTTTNTWAKRAQNNCHRKENTSTGWHKLNVGQ